MKQNEKSPQGYEEFYLFQQSTLYNVQASSKKQAFSADQEVIMLSIQNLYFLKNLYLVFSSDLPHSKRLTSTVKIKKKAVAFF